MIDELAPPPPGRRLCVYNGGLLTKSRARRILELDGWDVSLSIPGEDDHVGVWGRALTAWRGETVAEWRNAPLVTIEDAFLRSVHPGRIKGEAPIGLVIDKSGVHFDGTMPSDLEKLLATHPLDDTALLNRARSAIERMKFAHLGKYSATDPDLPTPDPAYVVVIDQTEGDAALMGAGRAEFREMLTYAAEEHPGLPIYIKTHPESVGGARNGHFDPDHLPVRAQVLNQPVSPWKLFEGAAAVYTHSSTLGFEAIFAGLKPRVFGQPFYCGWGLTQDQEAPARRERTLTRAQLFAAAMILYPVWYDQQGDRLCELEDVISQLSAEARAWREDRNGYRLSGMKPWKRPHLKRYFGREKPVRFRRKATGSDGPKTVVWGMSEAPEETWRMEDGFLRSRGLGAGLVPPSSLVLDKPTLYFDPAQEGRLDRIIGNIREIPPAEIERAERLIGRILQLGLTKYNISGAPPEMPEQRPRILVAGQVEGDASLVHGAGEVRTNLNLLERTRDENPEATILWKPHPDVEAGLRSGGLDDSALSGLADVVLRHIGADDALKMADAVWTITSTLGFEALLRGKPVTCLGMPFYAGRGLTQDLMARPAHRSGHNVTLDELAYACLIAYPRYFDPRSGAPLSPENAVALLASGFEMPRVNRWLAKARAIWPF